MKFLADMGVSMSTVQILRAQGHDVVHLRDEKLGRLSDPAILKKARSEGRVVLTFDLDFADILAAGLHAHPSVIIFRLHIQTPAAVTPRLLQVLAERIQDLEAGAVVSVEDTRYRLRRLPLAPTQKESAEERRS